MRCTDIYNNNRTKNKVGAANEFRSGSEKMRKKPSVKLVEKDK